MVFNGHIGHHLKRGHAVGEVAIFPVAGRRSELDAGGDDATQLVGARLSPHAKRETWTRDCRFSGER